MKKCTVAEIAEMFNVKKPTVYNWVDAGLDSERIKIPGKKRYRVIDPNDVRIFLAKEKDTSSDLKKQVKRLIKLLIEAKNCKKDEVVMSKLKLFAEELQEVLEKAEQ
jgi:transposase